jgi:hypothetical protein
VRSLAVALLTIAACVPSTVTPPAPDASDAAVPAPGPNPSCEGACAALAAAGCSEGKAFTCIATLANVDGQLAAPNGRPVTCAILSGVKTASDVTALGMTCSP